MKIKKKLKKKDRSKENVARRRLRRRRRPRTNHPYHTIAIAIAIHGCINFIWNAIYCMNYNLSTIRWYAFEHLNTLFKTKRAIILHFQIFLCFCTCAKYFHFFFCTKCIDIRQNFIYFLLRCYKMNWDVGRVKNFNVRTA